MFICTDEIDVMNTRFGVYLAGTVENDAKTVGSRLLCQGYDVVRNISRTTGSTSFHIERGSINILGASTGNMLHSVYRQFSTNSMTDGTVSRFMYVCTSAHKCAINTPTEILSVQPNIVHVLIAIRVLAEYDPIFVFAQHEQDCETSTTGLSFTLFYPEHFIDVQDIFHVSHRPFQLKFLQTSPKHAEACWIQSQ